MSRHTPPITDLAIVGAGPGGLEAARAATDRGLQVTLLDEQARPGGQIYRQPYADDLYPRACFGRAHVAAARAASTLLARPNLDWRGGRSVWAVQEADEGFELMHSGADGAERTLARKVLIAAGCYDMPVPFPGWTLPGVMGAGGIQALLKGQGVAPGERILLAGTHPLMLVIGAQLLAFGIRPQAVVFAQGPGRLAETLRAPLSSLLAVPVFWEGARAYRALRAAAVPVVFGEIVTRAEGDGRVGRAVLAHTGRRSQGASRTIECDTLGVCFGFTASTELPRQIGAAAHWSDAGGGWIVGHDKRMQTSVPGLYVAGETAGIGGAPCAKAEGRLAGLAAAAALGRNVAPVEFGRARLERARRRAFARLLRRLADAPRGTLLGLRDGDTILCRCESLTADRLRRVLEDNPTLTSANATKLLSRAGMGPCQGRYCHRAVQEEIAVARSQPVGGAGTFEARIPAKPVPLANLRGSP